MIIHSILLFTFNRFIQYGMYRPHNTWLESERALSHFSSTTKKVKGNKHHPQLKMFITATNMYA
jgi:hypothetical protein